MSAAGALIAATADPITYGGAPATPQEPVQRKGSRSTESFNEKDAHPAVDHETMLAKDTEDVEAARTRRQDIYRKVRGRVPVLHATNLNANTTAPPFHPGCDRAAHPRLVDQRDNSEGNPASVDRPDPLCLVLHSVRRVVGALPALPRLTQGIQCHRLPVHSYLRRFKARRGGLDAAYPGAMVQAILPHPAYDWLVVSPRDCFWFGVW